MALLLTCHDGLVTAFAKLAGRWHRMLCQRKGLRWLVALALAVATCQSGLRSRETELHGAGTAWVGSSRSSIGWNVPHHRLDTAVAAPRRVRKAPQETIDIKEALELLDIKPGASVDELRRAYRKKAKECHPDVTRAQGMDDEEAAAKFLRVQSAYGQLSALSDQTEEVPLDLKSWTGRFTWELNWIEVVGFGAKAQEQTLRDMVWFSFIWGAKRWGWQMEGARRDKRGLPPVVAGPVVLIQVLLPLLDEVTRRQLRIYRAEVVGDKEEARRLRAGRSQRHRMFDEWQEARKQEGEDSLRAQAMLEEIRILSAQVGDITAELEEYPEEWDLDIAEKLAMQRKALSERSG